MLARLLACFRCCKTSEKGDPYLQPLNLISSNGRTLITVNELVEQSIAARERLWVSLGSLEPFALSQNASSSSSGSGTLAAAGPKWPAGRQSFRVIHRPGGTVLLVSDGLSDPFDDIQEGEGNVNGFGVEFFIETPADELPATLSDAKNSWQFQLLFTLLSTEAEGVHGAIPEDNKRTHVNRAARVGALLGMTDLQPAAAGGVPEKIDGMPLTDVRLVNIKLISVTELKLITDRGAEGRRKLAELFSGPDRLVSSLRRSSAI
eukprot:scaffold3.g6459.t1